MAIYEVSWYTFWGWGSGYHTVDINFPPGYMGAQVWLHGKSGDGISYAGIKHYRKRLDNGEDQDIDFGDWPNWPPIVIDTISSITCGMATGEDQEGWAMLRLDYWE